MTFDLRPLARSCSICRYEKERVDRMSERRAKMILAVIRVSP
jgi:hypothetical protein